MELVERLATRFNARDAAAFAALFTEDGVLCEQDGRQHTGREEIRVAYVELFETWREIGVTHRECHDRGDRIVWLADIRSRARSVDLTFDAPFAYAIELRGELVVRMRIYAEAGDAFRALGLEPPA